MFRRDPTSNSLVAFGPPLGDGDCTRVSNCHAVFLSGCAPIAATAPARLRVPSWDRPVSAHPPHGAGAIRPAWRRCPRGSHGLVNGPIHRLPTGSSWDSFTRMMRDSELPFKPLQASRPPCSRVPGSSKGDSRRDDDELFSARELRERRFIHFVTGPSSPPTSRRSVQ